MRLSTRGRFAITAMIDLALREPGTPVPLGELAQRHHISLSYLEQVFAKLREHGLVDSTRGPGGGYTLSRKGIGITVADIVLAIEGEDGLAAHGVPGSPEAQDMTRELWAALHAHVMAHMRTITIGQLAKEQVAKGVVVPQRKAVRRGVFKVAAPKPVRPSIPNSVFALGAALAMGR